MGNGAKVAALAVGTYLLSLPLGLILKLNNCYYVPAMSKNIILISCLDNEGFDFVIKNKCCSVYLNDVFYSSANMMNGLYVLDLDRQILNVDTKKARTHKSNPSYLWHCR